MLAAAWISAISTVGLLIGAVVTAVFAIRAFREQSREVGLLQEQVVAERTEREREAEERRRAQAARVYVTLSRFRGRRANSGNEHVGGIGARAPSVSVTVHNTSEQPIYDLRVHWIADTPAVQVGAEDLRGTLGPHEEVRAEREIPEGVAPEHFTAVACFRDAAGARWTLGPLGDLDPVPVGLVAGAPLIATGFANRPRHEEGT
jgi:hypothetical protein